MFFFSDNAASACDLHFILMNALEALTSIKLKPTAIVCDQGSTNRPLYRVIGITVDQPFLYVSAHCMLPYTCTCHSTGLLSLLYIIIIIMSFELTCLRAHMPSEKRSVLCRWLHHQEAQRFLFRLSGSTHRQVLISDRGELVHSFQSSSTQ